MTISPEKLQTWVYKPCPGGTTLQLVHEQFGSNSGLVVASWTRDEVFAARDTGINQAELIIDDAQDHADSVGEACKFLVQWISESGRSLRSIWHRVAATQPNANIYAANADAISPNTMIAQLLSHIHQQQKLVNGSMTTVCGAYERAMNMQAAMLAQMSDVVKNHRRELDRLLLDGSNGANSVEATELAKLKARAFEKLIELGPDVMRMAVAAFAGAGDAGDEKEQHVNGKDDQEAAA